MPYFPDEFIQQVIERNDIVEVVGSYVTLKRNGGRYWACCPFHGEKTPSFSVNATQQFYYCFGCHAGGSVIDFVKRMERLDFVEAIKFLAERVRLPLPEVKNKGGGIPSDEKAKMHEVMRKTAQLYHGNLGQAVGEKAKAYLKNRGLPDAIIKRFGLGYAMDGWTNLVDAMEKDGFDKKTLLKVGLAHQKNDRVYDAFRNRVMFPIIDHRGRVIGFGGRVMDDSQPKYLNSPETPIFNKRYCLYGIHYLKRLRNIDRLMIVEGYMDVISLHRAGFETVVASLGTALTPQQARLLKRYCSNIYICYDGDAAGQKATLRGLDILAEEGLKVKVVTLPNGMDPDDYARKFGLVGIQDAMDQAMTLNDYKIKVIEQKYNLSNEEERKDFVTECCKTVLSKIEAPVERSMYVSRLHLKTGFPKTAIEAESEMARRKDEKRPVHRQVNNRNTIADGTYTANHAEKVAKVYPEGLIRAERLLLKLAVDYRECAEEMKKSLKIEDFRDEGHQEIVKQIYALVDGNRAIHVAGIMASISEAASSKIAAALEQEIDKEQRMLILKDCITRIEREKQKERIHAINVILRDPSTSKEVRETIMKELNELNKDRANDGRRRGQIG